MCDTQESFLMPNHVLGSIKHSITNQSKEEIVLLCSGAASLQLLGAVLGTTI